MKISAAYISSSSTSVKVLETCPRYSNKSKERREDLLLVKKLNFGLHCLLATAAWSLGSHEDLGWLYLLD